MKCKGGYNVLLDGRPAGEVHLLAEPEELFLPLASRRFRFSELKVSEGMRVHPGQVLAQDPENYSVPLLAPRAGTVRLKAADRHIVLEDVAQEAEEEYHPDEDLEHVPRAMSSVGIKRYKLLGLGAWQFFSDAYTGGVPDPFGTPSAVIVTTLHLEPYVARGDVQIQKRLSSFTRGLEHLQSLLEYQPVYLVVPDIESELARRVRETLRGYAWVKLVEIPRRYPLDHYSILSRRLGLKRDEESPVWALDEAGVLALDRALTLSRPATVRIISLGGPGVESPVHLKAMPGYPLRGILEGRVSVEPHRVINGGVLTGASLGGWQKGLDAECRGLTVLAEQEEREFLGFVRPGWCRGSYSRCFLSALRGRFSEALTTGLRGEGRPCIACGYCEEVCPAGIMPHVIHKYLYQDALEEAEASRVDLCIACGLCSYVCPSKLELRSEFIEALVTIQSELHPQEAEA